MNFIRLLLLIAALWFTAPSHGATSTPVDQQLRSLHYEVARLQSQLNKFQGSSSLILILFGAFCALWAQNTRRSAWLWFFLGTFFNVIAVIVVLLKGPHRPQRKRHSKTPRFQLPRSPYLE